jgi:hypothetical protein
MRLPDQWIGYLEVSWFRVVERTELISCSNWKWPDIDGLEDYKGHLVHSARWDDSYDFKDKTIAVIGVGSTAVQIVPSLQPLVKRMKCMIRSPTWITPGYANKYAGKNGQNFEYTPEQKVCFAASDRISRILTPGRCGSNSTPRSILHTERRSRAS